MNIDPSTTKYLIKVEISADGVIESPDVVGAIFGQTEGLLGDEMDLRDMQKSGRIGRIEVDIATNKGRSEGKILVPSSLGQVETSILAASLETIERVGPCKAHIQVMSIEDVMMSKRQKIIDRAKCLLGRLLEESRSTSDDLTSAVRESLQVQEIMNFGAERLPAGPNVADSDAIIVVEGRNDVLNLLKAGIKNAVAVEGTSIPKTVQELSKEKIVTAFVDGDRGGELVLRELVQVAEVDFVARAPQGREVEELTSKQIMKALRNKVPIDQAAHNGVVEKPQERQTKKEQRGGRDRRRIHDRRERPQQQAPKRELSEEQQRYHELMREISGTSKAKLISPSGEVVAELDVNTLADSLKADPKDLKAIVFDGVVSQRLVDIAAELGIAELVGTRMGSVAKQPTSVRVWLKSDFE